MAEYIERKKLEEAFDNADPDVCESDMDGHSDWGFGRENVRDVIRSVPAADVAQVVWIPVTDRLPEAGTRSNGWGDVTVIATNGKFVQPLIYERAIVRGKVVWRWKWPWDRIYDGNPVTHWMPLPEPPKGVSDNG